MDSECVLCWNCWCDQLVSRVFSASPLVSCQCQRPAASHIFTGKSGKMVFVMGKNLPDKKLARVTTAVFFHFYSILKPISFRSFCSPSSVSENTSQTASALVCKYTECNASERSHSTKSPPLPPSSHLHTPPLHWHDSHSPPQAP